MQRKAVLMSAQILVFFLYLQTSQSSEMFNSVIYARRRELLNMKVSQWKPFLQRLDHSLRSNLDVNASCVRDMRSFVDAVMRRSAAGLELLDSLGSLPNGIVQGSLVDEGSHKGCFSANVTDKNGRFVARKFCDIVVYLRAVLPNFPGIHQHQKTQAELYAFGQSFVKIGVCIPSSCTNEDYAVLINDVLSPWNLASVVAVCDGNETPEKTPVFIIFILGIFVTAVALATLMDVLNTAKPTSISTACGFSNTGKHFKERLRTLSVVYTLRETFRLDTSNDARLDVFNGLRAMTMLWVVVLHTHLYVDETLLENTDEVHRMSKTIPRQLIVNGTLSVAVFLTISGFMQWMTVWKRSNIENGVAGWFAVVIHRYLRMFPLVAVTVSFHYLHGISGHGTIWAYHTKLRREVFAEKWYQYLLGTVNFLGMYKICNPQQWYTSTDFQVFVFMLFFTMWLKRSGRTSPIFFVMALVVLYSFVENCYYQYPPAVLFFVPLIRDGKHGEHVYFMPYTHVPSYCLGILAGFWYTTKASRQLPKLKVAFLWVAALCAICIAQFGSVLWAGYEHPPRVTTALYAATHRGLFSAGIAWVICACLTDRAGFLTNLLAWPGWAPLSRLSFSAYMIQDIVIQYEWKSLASRVDGGYYFMGILAAGNFVASLVAAFLLHAFFEKPFALLVALLEEYFVPPGRQALPRPLRSTTASPEGPHAATEATESRRNEKKYTD
uniref:Nose resistant-to-fluoxetine protein N-terminal domain-containing protein n=1 Tax=Rhipicephalus pulchellus TaxID=72859 RepID=L7LX58_RHIPC